MAQRIFKDELRKDQNISMDIKKILDKTNLKGTDDMTIKHLTKIISTLSNIIDDDLNQIKLKLDSIEDKILNNPKTSSYLSIDTL